MYMNQQELSRSARLTVQSRRLQGQQDVWVLCMAPLPTPPPPPINLPLFLLPNVPSSLSHVRPSHDAVASYSLGFCRTLSTCWCILQVAIDYHPFAKGATLWNCVCVMYLSIFSVYWLYSLCHAVRDIHAASDIRHFTTHKLGLSESQLKTVTWPEVAKRIVNVSPAHMALQMLCCAHALLMLSCVLLHMHRNMP